MTRALSTFSPVCFLHAHMLEPMTLRLRCCPWCCTCVGSIGSRVIMWQTSCQHVQSAVNTRTKHECRDQSLQRESVWNRKIKGCKTNNLRSLSLYPHTLYCFYCMDLYFFSNPSQTGMFCIFHRYILVSKTCFQYFLYSFSKCHYYLNTKAFYVIIKCNQILVMMKKKLHILNYCMNEITL